MRYKGWQEGRSCSLALSAAHSAWVCNRYADNYSPVKLAAVASGKVSIDRLEEGDLDYATSADMMARLRGRMKSAIANFVGETLTG